MSQTKLAEAELLRAIPIFSGCSPEELDAVASSLEAWAAPAGTVIFAEGDPGDYMYIIASGQVRIVSDVETEKVIFAHLAGC
jgi:CRP/FNR family cyclic AMP-dependent transcriptional regulator